MPTAPTPTAAETALSGLRSLAEGDLDALLDAFADDAVIRVAGAEWAPFVGEFDTPERRRHFWTDAHAAVGNETMDISSVVDDGEQAVVLGHFRIQVTATQRWYDSDFAIQVRTQNGKIVHWQTHHDTFAVAEAFDRP